MNSSQSDFIHSYPPPRNQKHLLIPNSRDWWHSLWFLELFEQAQCCNICISQAFHGRRTRVTLMSYDFRPVTVLACVYFLGHLIWHRRHHPTTIHSIIKHDIRSFKRSIPRENFNQYLTIHRLYLYVSPSFLFIPILWPSQVLSHHFYYPVHHLHRH